MKCEILAGENQSDKCATSISGTDYWLIHSVYAGVERLTGSTVAVDVDLEIREQGGVFLPSGVELSLNSNANHESDVQLEPLIIVPPNADVRLVCTTNTNNTVVQGHIEGVLATVVGTVPG